MDIEYDQIKNEITSTERVDYNTDIGRSVMNVDYKVALICNIFKIMSTDHNSKTENYTQKCEQYLKN